MSLAYLHSDNMEDVRERLENTIEQSLVETFYDGEYCFITVTQRNETTGNESKWSFCVDFGDFRITMLEPVEDIEYFGSDNEIFRIIKNFLNGGSSREKRMNRPDYNKGEPIKIKGFGNKIGSSRKIFNYKVWKGNDYYIIEHEPGEKFRLSTKAKAYIKTLVNQKLEGRELYEALDEIIPNGVDWNDEMFIKEACYEYIGKLTGNPDMHCPDYDEIYPPRKPIKSSLSDVNKALGFTDKDIEEDGRIHITTDFGEFVVDYVNDKYIISYDGEERTFTEYKDTVEEVVDLFNKLCNEEVEFFDKNISSSKSIKSGISPEQNKFNWAYNGWFGHFQMNLDRVPQYLEGIKWCDANKGTSEYEQLCKEYNCYPVGDREKASFYNALKQVGAITSSKKLIKSDYSDEEYWYPETKKVYRLYKYNSNGDYYTWDYDTLEEAQRMKPRGNRYTTYNIEEVEVPVQSSKKPIKSSWFKPEDVIGYLVGGDEDTITAGDEDEAAARDVYYYGYGIMDDGEKGHLFIGKYDDVKDLVENWLGLGFTDEFAYPYIMNGVHITDSFQFLVSKPLPTEKDYRDFVNQLNKYVAENYETHGNYGPIYKFDMYKGEGTNSDGYGHKYPNFIIYDNEGNLDMHSDDDITEYIRNELDAKGWYPEAVHSSSDFTIAVM